MPSRTEVGHFRKHRVPFAYKATDVDEAGTFKGYASVFNNIDNGRDKVAPGAFAECLKAWKSTGDPMPVLWQHQAGEPIGGSDVLEEDEKGLYTEGWLLKDEIPQAKIAHTLMRRRVVKGMSIGYYIRGDSWDEKERVLTLTQVDLVEYSIVTFPMNNEALVEEVKSAASCGTIRELEDWLRDAGGFSAGQAKRLVSGGWPALAKAREDAAREDESTQTAAREVLSVLTSFKL